jgi:hypothetical protein
MEAEDEILKKLKIELAKYQAEVNRLEATIKAYSRNENALLRIKIVNVDDGLNFVKTGLTEGTFELLKTRGDWLSTRDLSDQLMMKFGQTNILSRVFTTLKRLKSQGRIINKMKKGKKYWKVKE